MGYIGAVSSQALVRRSSARPPSSPAALRAAFTRPARKVSTLGGPLTITITHGEVTDIGGLGDDGDTSGDAFASAVGDANQALQDLASRSSMLMKVATSGPDAEIAQLAYKMATITGPRGLQRAVSTGDANELIYLQRGIKGVSVDVNDALVTDAIQRFVVASLGFLLVGPFGIAPALLDADTLDSLKEKAQDFPHPPAPQELPLWAFAAGGAGAGGLMAFTSTGMPRAALAGAIGGTILGVALKYGLQSLADYFTLKNLIATS